MIKLFVHPSHIVVTFSCMWFHCIAVILLYTNMFFSSPVGALFVPYVSFSTHIDHILFSHTSGSWWYFSHWENFQLLTTFAHLTNHLSSFLVRSVFQMCFLFLFRSPLFRLDGQQIQQHNFLFKLQHFDNFSSFFWLLFDWVIRTIHPTIHPTTRPSIH